MNQEAEDVNDVMARDLMNTWALRRLAQRRDKEPVMAERTQAAKKNGVGAA